MVISTTMNVRTLPSSRCRRRRHRHQECQQTICVAHGHNVIMWLSIGAADKKNRDAMRVEHAPTIEYTARITTTSTVRASAGHVCGTRMLSVAMGRVRWDLAMARAQLRRTMRRSTEAIKAEIIRRVQNRQPQHRLRLHRLSLHHQRAQLCMMARVRP